MLLKKNILKIKFILLGEFSFNKIQGERCFMIIGFAFDRHTTTMVMFNYELGDEGELFYTC